MIKRILSVALLGAIALSLAACGGNSDGIKRKEGPVLEVYAEYKAEAEAAAKALLESDPINAENSTVEPYPILREYEPDWEDDQNEKEVSEGMLYINSPEAIDEGVYIGYNDWYFYHDTIKDFTGQNLFTEGQLRQKLNEYKKQYDYCKENGIAYYLTFAPNKNSIYPEYMHESYTEAEYKRLDQLIDYIKENSDIPVIELKDDLLSAKAENPDVFLYHRLDTHWNQHAGFIATNALLTEIQKDFPAVQLLNKSDFRIDYMETYMKDQAWYLGYYDSFIQEAPQYTPLNGWKAELTKIDKKMFGQFEYSYVWPDGYHECNHESSFVNPEKADAPSVVMFRDSFAVLMIHFMAESFSETTFYWEAFNIVKLRTHNPDIVIVEIAERTISN